MSEIPDDIRETALKLSSWTFGSTDDKDVMEVTAALMAERERCAKIADGWKESSWGDEVFAAKTIAAAIREGTPIG